MSAPEAVRRLFIEVIAPPLKVDKQLRQQAHAGQELARTEKVLDGHGVEPLYRSQNFIDCSEP